MTRQTNSVHQLSSMLTLCASRKSDAHCQISSFPFLQVLLVLTLPCSVLASGNPINQQRFKNYM